MVRKNRIPRNFYIPKGCGQQGRYPEGAHAASEFDDYKPNCLQWWIDEVVAAVCFAAAILFLISLIGLLP